MKVEKHLGLVQVAADVANVKALQARGPIHVQVAADADPDGATVFLESGDILTNEVLTSLGTGKIFVSAPYYDTDVSIIT